MVYSRERSHFGYRSGMDYADEPLDTLQERAARGVARYQSGELAPHEATAQLREVASLMVAARAHFFTKDGATDWGGRTGAFRAFVGETFRMANLSREQLVTVQNAVRYHVGNVLREQLPPDELAALGLRAISPRERAAETRATRTAAVHSYSGRGRLSEPADVIAAAQLADATLRRIDVAALEAIGDGDRAQLVAALASLSVVLTSLVQAAGVGGGVS